MKKFPLILFRENLLTIYKSFVRSNLDFADIIYDKPFNESLKKKIENLQYSAALIINSVFKKTLRDKLYQELGLESLAHRRWTRKLISFHKIILGLLPSYLQDNLIPFDNVRTYITRSSTQKRIKTFPARTKTFESSFFPYCAEAWGNLSEELRNINSINTFKSSILNFVRPTENSVFEVHSIKGAKLLTRLRLDFSHLNEHKFRNNFNDTINSMCSCGKEPETTLHYPLHCDLYSIYGLELLNDVCALNGSLKNCSEEKLLKVYFMEQKTSLPS